MGIIASTNFYLRNSDSAAMRKTDPVVDIEYKSLGTIAIDELKQAIWEDIEMLKDRIRRRVRHGRYAQRASHEPVWRPFAGQAAGDRRIGSTPRHAPLPSGLRRLQVVGQGWDHETALLYRP